MFAIKARHLSLVAVCLILHALCTMAPGAAGYDLHLVDPPITNHVILADAPLPPVCKPLAPVALHGCRGQYLPVSFVITTVQPLDQVTVEAAAVRGEQRQWPIDAVDIHVI